MTIKKKFLFITLFYFVLVTTGSFHLLTVFKNNNKNELLSRETLEILTETSRLKLLTIEMFNEHGESSHATWFLHHKSISEKTTHLASENIITKQASSRLKNDLFLLLEEFNDHISKYHNESTSESAYISKNQSNSLVKILSGIETFSNDLTKEKTIEENATKKYALFLYLGPIAFMLFTLCLLLYTQKYIVVRISTISDILNKITNGDFEVAIPETKNDDEIDSLFLSAKKMASLDSVACSTLKQKADTQAYQLEETIEKTEQAMLNILEDVEDEKEKAEKFAEDLKKFMLAVEGTSEEVLITNPDGIILYTNPAVKTTTGFSKKEILGKKIGTEEFWGEQTEKDFYTKLWETIKKKKRPFSGKIKNLTKQGQEYWTETNISPILDENKEVDFFVAIQRDITKEILIDKAKTEFVSLASHQLKTPLSSINWYTEMLLGKDVGKMNKQQEEYLNEVYQGNKRMIALVNALLNVSRIELGTFAIDPEPINVTKLVESVLGEMTQKIKQFGIILKTKFDKNIPTINADPQLLRIVFQNLISNAIKYNKKGGVVEITTRLDKKGQKLGGKIIKKDSLDVIIKDFGMGIPKHQQKNIFTKLFRADNAKKSSMDGTGLGLYIVKSIIDQSGGKIWFNSKQNKGTVFYVTIPLEGMQKKKGIKKLV